MKMMLRLKLLRKEWLSWNRKIGLLREMGIIILNRRHRDILNYILNAETYITGSELARICNVTLRTIRSDIVKINEALKEYNINVDSAAKKGYFLTQNNKDILIKNNVIRQIIDKQYIMQVPAIPQERHSYILIKLINHKYVSEEELAQELYVSQATINSDIVEINRFLKENLKLKINTSLNAGFTLNCNEKEKRNIISWILAKKMNVSTVLKNWNYLFQDNNNLFSEVDSIYKIVCDVSSKYKYYLSGHSSQLFSYEILAAFLRNKNGFAVNSSGLHDKFIDVMTELRQELQKNMSINLPYEEWIYIQDNFVCKQFIHNTYVENLKTEETEAVVDEFCSNILKKYGIDLTVQKENREKLILYAAPMINRLKNNYCIPNKIDENIVKKYKNEFKIAQEMNYVTEKKLNLKMNLAELSYITLYMVSMCTELKFKANTILLSDYDESVLCLIKICIENYFSNEIKLTGFYTYNDFKYEDKNNLKDIDFIITTSTIAGLTNIPFVRIKAEIDENDIEMIKEAVLSDLRI